MRTNDGHEVLENRGDGEPELVERLLRALHCRGRVERWTHGFHTYPARLHPDAAAELLMGEGLVFDPFVGGGTVLVEAMVAGRECAGADISPTALRVASARTQLLDDPTLTLLRSTARRMAERARSGEDRCPDWVRDAVGEWYAPWALQELASLRHDVADAPEAVKDLLEAALSSILIKVSWRASDTRARREEHHRPPGTTATLFHKRVREQARQLVALRDAVPDDCEPPVVRMRDARRPWARHKISQVLTSPPYPGVYDYLPMQHLRDVWIGKFGERGEEIGSRRSWRRDRDPEGTWRADTRAWLERAHESMAPGAHLVVVIGDGLVQGRTVDARAGMLDAVPDTFRLLADASVARPDHARNAVRWEHGLVWQRR